MIQEDGWCEDIGQSTALTCNSIKRTLVKETLTLGPIFQTSDDFCHV